MFWLQTLWLHVHRCVDRHACAGFNFAQTLDESGQESCSYPAMHIHADGSAAMCWCFEVGQLASCVSRVFF